MATYLVGAAASYLVQAENKANSAPLELELLPSLTILDRAGKDLKEFNQH